jgi:hypothetical protein
MKTWDITSFIDNAVLITLKDSTEINATRALVDASISATKDRHTTYWLAKALFTIVPNEFKEKFDSIKIPNKHIFDGGELVTMRISAGKYIAKNVFLDGNELCLSKRCEDYMLDVIIPKYSITNLSLDDVREIIDKYTKSSSKLKVITSTLFYTKVLEHTIECIKNYYEFVKNDLPWKALSHDDMNKQIDLVELLSGQDLAPSYLGEIIPILRELQMLVESNRHLRGIISRNEYCSQSVVFVNEYWTLEGELIGLIRECVIRGSPTLSVENNKNCQLERNDEPRSKTSVSSSSESSDSETELDIKTDNVLKMGVNSSSNSETESKINISLNPSLNFETI